MRGLLQSEIFGMPPFGPHFGRGPCHWRRFVPDFIDLEKMGWMSRGRHGFHHGPGKHHGHHDHHGHHEYHDHHGHHEHNRHHGHHEHHGHKGHHCPRKLRTPSPDCHCEPRSGSPGPQDRCPNRAEDSSPERRDWGGIRRKNKLCRSNMCRGPCGRSPYDCYPPRFHNKPGCCKKQCRNKEKECSGNECTKENDTDGNCTENRNNEAVLYERVVVENNPGAPSV